VIATLENHGVLIDVKHDSDLVMQRQCRGSACRVRGSPEIVPRAVQESVSRDVLCATRGVQNRRWPARGTAHHASARTLLRSGREDASQTASAKPDRSSPRSAARPASATLVIRSASPGSRRACTGQRPTALV
jgi:hypothetical protein